MRVRGEEWMSQVMVMREREIGKCRKEATRESGEREREWEKVGAAAWYKY